MYDYHRWNFLLSLSRELNHKLGIDCAIKNLTKNGYPPTTNLPNMSGSKISFNQLPLKAQESLKIINKIPTQEELKDKSLGSKVYLIVPYKDGGTHLEEFIQHMISYFEYLEVDYQILIMEQTETKLNNKFLLFNLAIKYIEGQEPNNNIYCCFHEMNILPTQGTNYYKPNSNVISHLYGNSERLDGVFTINLTDLQKINGFPKLCQMPKDDSFLQRVIDNGLKIDKIFFNKRHETECFKELDHLTDHNTDDQPGKDLLLLGQSENVTLERDILSAAEGGLDQIKTIKNILTVETYPDYLHIKADLNKLSL